MKQKAIKKNSKQQQPIFFDIDICLLHMPRNTPKRDQAPKQNRHRKNYFLIPFFWVLFYSLVLYKTPQNALNKLKTKQRAKTARGAEEKKGGAYILVFLNSPCRGTSNNDMRCFPSLL
jgi:hypothetical protein